MYPSKPPKSGNLSICKRYFDAGLSLIPVHVDGSKRPKIRFAEYQYCRMPWFQLQHWFSSLGRPSGIAILCGQSSGNLEVLDFDDECSDVFPAWSAMVAAVDPTLIGSLPIVQTPTDGRHVYYRCELIKGNQKLATTESGGVLIETRGQGGYVVAPGSPPETHSTGREYELINGSLLDVPTISQESRQLLIDSATRFDRGQNDKEPRSSESQEPSFRLKKSLERGENVTGNIAEITGFDAVDFYGSIILDDRPGDQFNKTACWKEILEPHGWTISHSSGSTTYWRRPGKFDGVSATTNHAGSDLLYVFSSNATPFVAGRSYDKFAAFTFLNHDGNFSAAAAELPDEDLPIDSQLLEGFYEQNPKK